MPRADGKITVVSYDSATLETTRKRAPKDRGMLARALAVINSMQPKAVGIDLIFDQPQPEDDQLVRTLRSMRTPTWIAYLGDRRQGGRLLHGRRGRWRTGSRTT